jgi:hypothetical protein
MTTPTVKITIKPGQPVKIEALNVQGSGCMALTQPLREAFGETEAPILKPEFYEEATVNVDSQVNVGGY